MFAFITNLLTLFSVMLVWATLNEMQVQRNQTYKPDIIIKNMKISVSESIYRKEETLVIDPEDGYEKINWKKYADLINTDDIDMDFIVFNGGMGPAKNLCFQWDNQNYKELMDAYVKMDSRHMYSKQCIGLAINDRFSLESEETTYIPSMTYQYLLPNAQDSFKINFPIAYYAILKAMVNSADDVNLIYLERLQLELRAKISYVDNQGVKYMYWHIFHVNLTDDIEENSRGRRSIIFEIINEKLEYSSRKPSIAQTVPFRNQNIDEVRKQFSDDLK